MTNPQVLLPKKVAEAIESELSRGYSNQQILTYPYSNDYQPGSDRSIIQDFRKENFDILMAGLVNGYEVEKTPHEKLLVYYSYLVDAENQLEQNNQSGSQFRQGWQSVEKTLGILGITIKGINDK